MKFYQFLTFPDESVAIRRTEFHQWEVLKGRRGRRPGGAASCSAGDFIGIQNRSLAPAIDAIRRACERNANAAQALAAAG